ncbi:MAG TPA: trimethylamine methyltransferase family protein [Anaerolineae bacterium]|nr:trimethylamine methyltransferase family protein [Anaerolineae bacterium]
MIRPQLQFLSQETVDRALDEAYELLTDPGVRIHYDEALRLLGDAGADVDLESRVARIPRSLAEKAVETAPSSFHLYDLDGEPVVHYGGDDVHFDPGSAAIEIIDYEAKESRTPVTADCENCVRLAEKLPQIDAVATSIVCGDVPKGMGDWYRLYLLLLYARKPIITGTFSIESFSIMHELLVAVAGSAEVLADKPRAVFDACPSPPLMWSDITCANLIDAARARVPAELIPMPLMGATGPATIIGSAVQHAAEALSGITIHQLANPGSPIVWGGSPAYFDMRTGAPPMGAMATMMLDCTYAQIGKRIKPGGLPTHAYLGMSDTKIVDAQTGLESASGAILGALAGINMMSGPGMMDFESCFSLEKLVIDAEIVGMAKRLVRGVDDSEQPLALDVMREVGHKGNFLATKHTARHYRAEDYMPSEVIDRDYRQGWFDKGALDVNARAHRRVKELIASYEPLELPEDVMRELKAVAARHAKSAGLDQLPELSGR